ncbi:MAG: glycosyltransferase [Gammaproteobacteria bacterium]|nr:glycosyltransferase [Gammaproteobacteria bacterium]
MRKNVLILSHSYGSQFLESCNQYSLVFDPQEYETTVVYLSGSPSIDIKNKTLAEHTYFFDIPTKQLSGLKLKAIKKIYTFCKEKKFSIVICHRYKPSYIMLWVAQFYSFAAMIFVMHAPETMLSKARQWLVSHLLKKNMLIAGVSHAIEQDIKKDLPKVPAEQIITLYNIIDSDLFSSHLFTRQGARLKLNLSEQDFIFGNLARLVIDKDQKTLIHAFSQIKNNCPNAKLIIMGNGKLEHELKKQVSDLKLENEIIFTGFIEDGFRFMKAFDVFVLSSISEAFGRVLLEAMIAHTPIIAARSEGIPEVIGDTGVLVDAANPEQLAHEMQKAYHSNSTELSALAEKSFQRIDLFTLPTFKKDFWNLPLMKSLMRSP